MALSRQTIVAALTLLAAVTALAAAPESGAATPTIALTDAEREWIREHPVIRVIALDDYAPYLITESNGRLAGLSVNLIDLIAQRTGLKFEYHKHQSVAPAMAEFKAGGGDVLPALAWSKEREEFVLFSQPYASAFAVIVTRLDSPYLNSLHDLNGRQVGSLRGAIQGSEILAAAPQAQLVDYATVQQSLVGLARGEVDATYASVGTAAYYMKHLQLSNLRLGSVVGSPKGLHVGVRKDWPVLADIINKALASVTPSERKLLDDQWIFVAQAPNRWLPWLRVAAIVAAIAITVALFLLYFYRRMARELAERLRIQVELEDTHRALARVSEEKSEMMRSIAHDLRNPLTGVILGNQLLETLITPADPNVREVIASQRDACRKILSRVDELVNPGALETGQRELRWEQLDLVALVQETVSEQTKIAGAKNIALTLSAASATMPLLSDKAALAHVTDNLVGNAIKYSPRHTRIRLELLHQAGGYVLHVTDQGPGVPPEERETIFERHARGSAQPTGGEKSTGLGLWIVRRTVASLQGRVWCGPGRETSGATFSVFVPFASPGRS
jgi:signal transduction histidine kinase